MTKEALKLALEALDNLAAWTDGEVGGHMDEPYSAEVARRTITAIKEALAQPEQEPVVWRYKILDYFGRPVWTLKTPKTDIRVLESQPLYTTPPQRKPLSDDEILSISADCAATHQHTDIHFARAIEAKLKEKNT